MPSNFGSLVSHVAYRAFASQSRGAQCGSEGIMTCHYRQLEPVRRARVVRAGRGLEGLGRVVRKGGQTRQV